MRYFNSAVKSGVLLFSLLGSTSAMAIEAGAIQSQEEGAGSEAAADANAAETVGLSDIVVTAQRKSESLQRAAIPVDVVASDEISKSLISHPSQLNNLVPSLQVGSVGGSSVTFYLRGVGTSTTNSYTDSAIAFNLDGVYIARPSSTTGYFYDLARIEVLKGPQGTLYGRNATGGAINVIPATPELGRNSIDFAAVLGNYDTVNLQGAVNLAVSDNSAIRVAGVYAKHDGYLSDGTSAQNERAIRGQFLFSPTPDLRVRISADYLRRLGTGVGTITAGTYAVDYVNNRYITTPTGFDQRGVGYYDPRVAPVLASNFVLGAGGAIPQAAQYPQQDGHFWGVQAQIDWTTPVGTLTVAPAYRDTKVKDIANGGGNVVYDEQEGGQTSVEARLSGSAASVDYIVGGLYFHDKVNAIYSPNFQVALINQEFRSTTDSYAAFGRLTYHVSDNLRLVGGARFTKDTKSFVGQSQILGTQCLIATASACTGVPLIPFSRNIPEAIATLGLVQVPAPVPFPAYIQPGPFAGSRLFVTLPADVHDDRSSWSQATYRAAVEFDVAPQSLLYASFETGFRSGGFAFSTTKPSFNPEKIKALTLGSKNRFFDNALQLNLEAFYWKYSDQQVSHFDNAGVFVTENIGKSTIKGAELEVQWLATPNTRLSFDGQYLDAKYDHFVYTTASTLNPVLTTPTNSVYLPAYNGCRNFENGAGVTTIDCSGFQAQYSPKWTLSLSAQQTIPLGDNRIVLTAATRYQSASWTGIDYLPQDRQQGYRTSRADVTFVSAGDHLSMSAFVMNIENNRHRLFTGSFAATQALTAAVTDPRTYGIRMGFSF